MRQLVLIPSYNPGALGLTTLREARLHWSPVWVVVDGSTDGSRADFEAEAARDPQVRVLVLAHNRGKGAAVLHGLEAAAAAGFTHVLTMDSDGQHPAHLIPQLMLASAADGGGMVLGAPVFGSDAPSIRVRGRRICNFWVNVETMGMGIADSLYGFRVYPIEPLRRIMRGHVWMRRFDFDVEAVVRLCWAGVWPVNLPAPVRYLRPDEGGVSHFRYLRDNVLLTWMHARLFFEFLVRLPWLLLQGRCGRRER